jgi:hypothetical protein
MLRYRDAQLPSSGTGAALPDAIELGDAGVIAGNRISVDDARSDAQPGQASTIRRRRAMALDHSSIGRPAAAFDWTDTNSSAMLQ